MWQQILQGPSPEWLRLNLDDWHALDRTPAELVYGRAPNDLLILRCTPGKPDIGYPLDDLASLRKLSRLQAQEMQNKLVSLEPFTPRGEIQRLSEIFGAPSGPVPPPTLTARNDAGLCAIYGKPSNGMYWAELTFPFADFALEICVYCRVPRGGVVGARDSSVFVQLSQAGVVHPETCYGFYQDPYEPELCEGPLVRTLAEAEIWDASFPDHELSRLRRHLAAIRESLSFHPLLALAPRFTGLPSTIAELLARARADLKLNRLVEASASFELALMLAPSCVDAHEGRGWALLLSGRSELGLEHASAAIRLAPERARAYQLRGRLLASLGRRDEAMLDFARAAALVCPVQLDEPA